MSRLSKQSEPVQEAELVEFWINDRFVLVVQTLEEALYAIGYDTRTTVDISNNISTYVVLDGRLCGIIDLKRVLLAIATCDIGYDKRLNNALYEISKIHRVVADRVQAAQVLFGASGDDVVDQLCDLSRDLGIKFLLVESE